MNIRTSIYCLLLVAPVILVGCLEDDNPDLINPPVLEGSIQLRMLNLAEEGAGRTLELESGKNSSATPYGSFSEFIEIDSDSLFAEFTDNAGTVRFRSDRRLRFLRNSYQTMLALPARETSEFSDTALFINVVDDSLSRPENIAFVRLINVAVNSDLRITMRRGCPNGLVLANNINPYVFSGQAELAPGAYIITLSAFDPNSSTVVVQQSFEIMVEPERDYAIIVRDADASGFDLLFLDERLETPQGLLPITISEATESRMRVVNFSTETISVEKLGDDEPQVIAADLALKSSSPYTVITACESTADDEFQVIRTDDSLDVRLSLDVLVDYTILVAPDDDDPGTTDAVVLPPYSSFTDVGFDLFCNVRVVNLIPGDASVQMLLGARTTDDGVYEPGFTLARKAPFSFNLAPIVVRPGPAPILMFTEATPRRLLETSLVEFEANKRYLVIAALDVEGEPRIYVIDEDGESDIPEVVPPQAPAVFTQFVNVVSDVERSSVSYGNVIQAAERFHGEFGATALEPGPHTFTIDGVSQEIELFADKRTLVLASGTAAAIDIQSFESDPFAANLGQIRRRYINASNLVPQAMIALDSLAGDSVLTNPLEYLSTSDIKTVTIERRTSFVAWEAGNDRTSDDVLINADVSQNFGKNYSIILSHSVPAGEATNRENAKFRLLVQQEY